MILWLAVGLAAAHPLAPSVLEVNWVDATTADVAWRRPTVVPVGPELLPLWPAACSAEAIDGPQTDGARTRWTRLHCPDGLAAHELRVDGLTGDANVVGQIVHPEGTARRLLHGSEARLPMIPPEASPPVWSSYLRLGAAHLLAGLDHVLLVLGLVLLLGRTRTLVGAVTAFTLGHSLTLGLAASGVVYVPSAPVEAAIAASLVWLAAEVCQGSESSALRRHPWLLSGVVGLVHGLGFAGGLAEIGLPQRELVAALFGFNLGVELAQLAVVGVALAVGSALGDHAPRLALPVGWGIGLMGATWFWERISLL